MPAKTLAPYPRDNVPVIRRRNRSDTAAFFEVSPNTLDSWVRKGCPVMSRGGRGVAHEFDLLAVICWRAGVTLPCPHCGRTASIK